jgi:hypothetical protein
MDGPRTIPPLSRNRLNAAVTLVLAVLLLSAAFVRHLRPEAIDDSCPPMYADPTHDPSGREKRAPVPRR